MELVAEKYKQTEIGLIPSDWEIKQLFQVVKPERQISYGIVQTGKPINNGIKCIRVVDIIDGNIDSERLITTTKEISDSYKRTILEEGDLMIALRGKIGAVGITNKNLVGSNLTRGVALISLKQAHSNEFFRQQLTSENSKRILENRLNGSALKELSINVLRKVPVAFPPTKPEQTAIATALSDADALITSLEKLIAKKQNIKQGAMQQLLTPKENWVVKKLGEVVNVLDNLRIPLNDNQRAKMKGDIPYCGANGIVDYVNDFVIDDDIILMAEDGGYFDEYKTRPIAYRMIGKCWVNNHAHILKSKPENDQGFLYFSLVHKNIIDFINGGTRAKLNKGELVNIEINIPLDKGEQTQIATILSDMDAEIELLDERLTKSQNIKQAMMQQLLTGKIRLV